MPFTENHIGYRPVDTSYEAAIRGNTDLRLIRTRILNFLRVTAKPFTSEEISDSLGIDYRSVQPRLSELRDKLQVRDSGQRRNSRFNRPSICWEAVPKDELP